MGMRKAPSREPHGALRAWPMTSKTTQTAASRSATLSQLTVFHQASR